MDDFNPYAAPPILAEQILPNGMFADENEGLWRQGDLLVIRKGARLPPRCLKSNEPARRYLRRNLTWVPAWVYLLILVNLLICVIVSMVLQKKATINIGLSDEWFSRRRRNTLLAWGIVGLAVLSFFAGIMLIESAEQLGAALMIAAPFILIGGAIFGLITARLVYPKKIDDRFIWLKGVCPEFLNELPFFNGPM
jgi:hypothetical protein